MEAYSSTKHRIKTQTQNLKGVKEALFYAKEEFTFA